MSELKNFSFNGNIDNNIILFGEIFLASLSQMSFSGYVLSPSFNIKYIMKEHDIMMQIYNELYNYLTIAISFVIIMAIFFYVKSGVDAMVIFILLNIIIISIIYYNYINAINFAVNVRDVVPQDGSKSPFEKKYYKNY
jgi:hypothetical protein